MRNILLTLFLCALSIGAADRKPNVIIIFTDDQGSVDLNCYGAKDLVTPHMDSLAKHGVRFTQFYAAAPVCSPSRAGLLTGRYPVRAGVPGNVPSKKGGVGMPASQVTIAETFKDAGYATSAHRQMAPRLHDPDDAQRAGLRSFLRPHGWLH